MKRFRPQTDHHLNRFTRAAHRRLAPIGLAQVRRWRSRRGPARPSLRRCAHDTASHRSIALAACCPIDRSAVSHRSVEQSRQTIGRLRRQSTQPDNACSSHRQGESAEPIGKPSRPISERLCRRSVGQRPTDQSGPMADRSGAAPHRSVRPDGRSVKACSQIGQNTISQSTPSAARAADRSVRVTDLHAATTDRSGLPSISPIDMPQPQLRRARAHIDRREEVTDRLAALTDRAVLHRSVSAPAVRIAPLRTFRISALR